MVLDAALFSTQHYKMRIGAILGMVWHSPLHRGVEANEKEAFWSPLTKVANFTCLLFFHKNDFGIK